VTLAATITPGEDGWLAVRFDYTDGAVDGLKATVPSRCRRWQPATKTWLVDASYRAAVAAMFAAHGYRVTGGPQRAQQHWAGGLFAALPVRLHDPAYRALSRVLHPDFGGDTQLQQELNDARRRL